MFWNQLCFLLPSPLWLGHFARLSFLPKTFTPLGDWLCSCPSPSDFVQPTLLLVTRTTPGSVSNSQKSWCQQKKYVGRCECWKTFNQGHHLFWSQNPGNCQIEKRETPWDETSEFRAGSMAEQTRQRQSEWMKKIPNFSRTQRKGIPRNSSRLNYLHI